MGALVIGPEGQLLLLKSHKWRGLYGLPGGHVELGETLQAAVEREVAEETGLEVHRVEFLLFQEMIFDDAFWARQHFIFFEFVCHTSSTEVKLNREAQESLWSRPQDALELPLDPYTHEAVVEYLARRDG